MPTEGLGYFEDTEDFRWFFIRKDNDEDGSTIESE